MKFLGKLFRVVLFLAVCLGLLVFGANGFAWAIWFFVVGVYSALDDDGFTPSPMSAVFFMLAALTIIFVGIAYF